ncbi:MFS transporter [Hamadaea tsunoensis]|uniref:MFS transporter n=1 Tax=Hamadaea tsunoensis TaxID=53368 RepID=UPI0004173B8A|nr:MFS transporter [Hamadaea tsunoensis]
MSQTTDAGIATEAPAASLPRAGLILVLLSLAQFMVILDVTVVNVALPAIGQSLHLGREALTWVITAYVTTFGGLLILGGRLADALGRKTAFLAGVGVFTLSSLVAGLATGGPMLLAGRVAQGVGAALLSPAALAVVTTEFTGRDRTRALGVWAAIGGVGAALGVVVGGLLTSGPGWEWAFFVNVPVGILVAATLPRLLPARPRSGAVRLDIPGAVLGVATVALLIFGVVRAGATGFGSAAALVPIGLAVVAGIFFVLVERRSEVPLVPLGLLTGGALPGAVAVMMAATGVLYAAFFLSSIFLQDVRQFSALKTGLILLPIAVAIVGGAHLGGGHIGKFGPHRVAAGGLAITAVGVLGMAWVGPTSSVLLSVGIGFFVAAFGIGATFVTAIGSGVATVDERNAGVASGILNTGHEFGGALGVALVSAVAGGALTGTGPVAAGFDHAYLVLGAIGLLGAIVAALVLPRDLPATGDGRRFLH